MMGQRVPGCFLNIQLTLCVCSCVPRSSWGSLPSLIGLLSWFVLCSSLLDSHLQASVAWGTGLHATPQEGEPRAGAVPALPMWGWTQLPNAARLRSRALTIICILFVITAGHSNKIQVCSVLASPLVSANIFAVFCIFVICKVIASSGKDETSCVPERDEQMRGMKDRLRGGK